MIDTSLLPKEWDVIMFFTEESGKQCIETFLVSPLGKMDERQESSKDEKIQCHVGLVTRHRDTVRLEEPFTAHFYDPFVYVDRLLKINFSGVLVKAGQEHLKEFFNVCHAMLEYNIKHGADKLVEAIAEKCDQ